MGEHASIPSFARFIIELAAVGAPPTLLERAAAAIADEVRHAKMAFEMAGELLGRSMGPSELDVAGAITNQPELGEICLATFAEGCVGEGIAVEQARAAADSCAGKARQIWETVAQDEHRHAELAWATVEWMLAKQPHLRERLRAELERMKSSGDSSTVADDREGLLEYGILSRRRLADVARATFKEKVYPRACALLENRAYAVPV